MTPAAIQSLTDAELRGWWDTVIVARIQSEREGERAALLQRAKALGVTDIAEIGKNPFVFAEQSGTKEAGRDGATNTNPALEHRHLNRRRPMSRCGQYSDSACADNPQKCDIPQGVAGKAVLA
ncbi:hypothetical protein K7H20_13880 [Salipiger manganoxidans]|uniref:hypothetical protein n=1 Tax=Salipiger marinus TaxID=555512 RepID=UPI001E50AEC2|nr:hypothetical protein [Salipiger manganoxidans]MCD1619155.1 hypothetical protein [Salipiger manganoxidans]